MRRARGKLSTSPSCWRVGGGSGRRGRDGHRHAARVGVSAGGWTTGILGRDARRRAPGRRGDPWGPVPRRRVQADGPGAAAGIYDLAVFPWSNVTGSFAPPQIVHVTVR